MYWLMYLFLLSANEHENLIMDLSWEIRFHSEICIIYLFTLSQIMNTVIDYAYYGLNNLRV